MSTAAAVTEADNPYGAPQEPVGRAGAGEGLVTTSSPGFWALVATQFCTAFNDNAFRFTVILIAAERIGQVATVLFLLPYALFSLHAGVIADRRPKHKVIFWWKVIELPLVACALGGLLTAQVAEGGTLPPGGPLYLMLVMLFGLGLQTSFLSPARYGIIPEAIVPRQISDANGKLEFGTYLGILGGMLAAGFIAWGLFNEAAGQSARWAAAAVMPVVGLVGLACSTFIPKVAAAAPGKSMAIGAVLEAGVGVFKRDRMLLGTAIALTAFWLVSLLYTVLAPYYAERFLLLEESRTEFMRSLLLVTMFAGVGVGSWVAGKISRGAIELALTPVGAVVWGMAAIGLAAVAWTIPNTPAAAWWTYGLMAVSGVGAGLFVVPLNAFLEWRAPETGRGAAFGVVNLLSVLGMIAGTLIDLGRNLAGLSPAVTFLAYGILLILGALAGLWTIRDWFIRFAITNFIRTFYRLEVVGGEHLPDRGGALIVSNHMSYQDGNIVTAVVPRFCRFVVLREHYGNAILRWVGTTMNATAIDATAGPKELIGELRGVGEKLSAGEICCIFPEGTLTRTGTMLPFRRGVGQILKNADVPVIPMYIDGMWGSIFSFHRGRFFRKWPSLSRRTVRVQIGAPVKFTDVQDLRTRVLELGTEAYARRAGRRLPLHRQFVRTAKKHRFRPCVTDSKTETLSYGAALMRSVILRDLLAAKLGPERYVGIFLPPSVGGVLANIAVSFLGKIPVNLNYTVGKETLDHCVNACEIKQALTSKLFVHKLKLQPDAELVYLEELRKDLKAWSKVRGVACRILPAFFTDWLLGLGGHKGGDVATVIFSSGSTGTPKGVVLTHDNVGSDVDSSAELIDATTQDSVMGVLPFFHSFGYTGTIWLPLCTGMGAVYHFSPLEAKEVGGLIKKHGCTIFIATATFLRGYIRRCEAEDFATVRLLICGAEKLPQKVSDEFERKFGVAPMEGYGCTELAPAVSSNRPDVMDGELKQVGRRPGTIGHTMPGQAARIVDPDSRAPLPLGEEGLLLIKGPNVMKEYLNRPDLTAEVISDGWYATGDMAKLDADGFITITDRLSRFSKIGGEMVPHGKIEDEIHDILDTHERLVAVVGVPDERKGERLVVLHTELPKPLDEVWNGLKERVPGLWLPGQQSFHRIDELPVLGSGKLDLKGVRKIALEKAEG